MDTQPKLIEIGEIEHVFKNETACEAYFMNKRLHHKIKIIKNKVAPRQEDFRKNEDVITIKSVSIDQEMNYFCNSYDSLQRSLGKILAVGQCFGLLPVIGVLESDPSQLRFEWCTWRVGYTLICIAAMIMMISFCLFRLFFTDMDFYKTMSTAFFANAICALILFLRLASKWPSLMLAISERERPMFSRMWSLSTRFKIYTFAIFFPALIEHSLSLFSCIAVALDCSDTVMKFYFMTGFPQIFSVIEYTDWKGITAQIINFVSTYIWNYTDLFIILISVGLTNRFDQLNKKLDIVKNKNLSEHFWKAARDEYVHLSLLVKKIDDALNPIILLSFASNVYFICVQLFNSFRAIPRTGCVCSTLRKVLHVIYFIFSFGFLILRWLAVSLNGAKINIASRYPATIIYSTPSQTYGIEQSRFLEQVINDMIAFTGMNFFYLTRGLILTIAGTIVTYELVLVQFNVSASDMGVNVTSSDICI